MAKKENTMDLKGGLTAGLDFNRSKDAVQTPAGPVEAVRKETAAPVEPVQPEAVAEAPQSVSDPGKSLNELYEKKRKTDVEARTVRIQAVVTPSTARALDALVEEDKIKSRNDLINFLLEGYLGNMK